jgi:hypothetical protein
MMAGIFCACNLGPGFLFLSPNIGVLAVTELVGSPRNTYDAYKHLYDRLGNMRMACLMLGIDRKAIKYTRLMRYLRIRYAREHLARLV